MTNKREYYVCEPPGTANASVIWLHGLGADGKDFVGLVDQLGLPPDHGVRFIFPSAPFINVTVNHGMVMRGWYDIYDLNMLQREDAVGIKKSQKQIEGFIAQQLEQGIAADQIILAGFSQGGAMSLYTGLNYAQALCGIIVLSAYLPLSNSFEAANFQHKDLPIFMAHGLFDPIVPYALGHEAYDILTKQGYNIEWLSYPMPHSVCIEEIVAIGSFIQRCFGYA